MGMQKHPYTHILQKTGVLKNFTVAKVVKKQEIDEIKKLVKKVASSEEEYKRILEEEMLRMSNMHDKNNPIPGIIYAPSADDTQALIYNITKKFCQGLKKQNLGSRDLAFLITAIINELGLTQKDFTDLRNELNDDEDKNYDGDGEEESSDEAPPKF